VRSDRCVSIAQDFWLKINVTSNELIDNRSLKQVADMKEAENLCNAMQCCCRIL
jgi:hypothetical protein